MHISKVQIVNYRNFSRADIRFNRGINTIIGENGSGKTNLFRAMRLLLDDNLLRMAYRLDETDFHRALGSWRGHWIIISLEFQNVSQDEAIQSLFLHGVGNIEGGAIGTATYNLIFRPKASVRAKLGELQEGDQNGLAEILHAITLDDYETVFTGKSTADFTNPAVYETLVGNFAEVRFPDELEPPEIGGRIPGIMSITKEVSFTFVQALRDVVSDFQNNRTNPLLTLLRGKSGEISAEAMAPITALVQNLNTAIIDLPEVESIRSDIRETITDAAGETYSPSTLSIRSALPEDADRLFQSLRLFVGESDDGYEGAIHELSLGGANLIYLTLKLLEFKYQTAKHAFANFLLIEEPEAHIHTHIQKTLFDRLNFPETQVIYSTHSTHISEVSNVENVNILGRVGGACEVFQPATGLQAGQVRSIQRYLDAVRSNLLFAKSVVLVEGDAEEILVPVLVKQVLGVSLDELGISLINIRSTGFKNVAVLFHDSRIRKRCAIVTDLDATFFDAAPDPLDAPAISKAKEKARGARAAGLRRQADLQEFANDNPWMSVHFAPHTFEVDFVAAGNASKVVGVLGEIYTDVATIALAKEELESNDVERFGTRALTMASSAGKGWFAIQVAKLVDPDTHIPDYLAGAIFTAHRPVSTAILANMLDYRLGHIRKTELYDADDIAELQGQIQAFRAGQVDRAGIRDAMLTSFPADQINAILAHV
ncbi:recombination protein F [Aminobacter sp. MSH1]|uniref:ATP-dependent nuclease n=1 Tax=Aminobacter sp. MSH1 TaxID=374606 RepID=UPI000D3A8079|nr:AAA family ATPase [Aminobacter sp. MSH1]AWC25162.1 recombination protein F [Aminobacter sp. MSH1]